MSDYRHSAHANAARLRKAIALESSLRAGGFTADLAASMTPKQRREAERIAGVNTSSDDTWDLVLAFMRDYEAGRASVAEASDA